MPPYQERLPYHIEETDSLWYERSYPYENR